MFTHTTIWQCAKCRKVVYTIEKDVEPCTCGQDHNWQEITVIERAKD